MMPGWIDNPADTPSMGVGDWINLSRSGCDSLFAYRRRVFHDQQHSNRAAAQRFGTEIEVLLGLFGDPELRASHGQLNNSTSWHAMQFSGPERRFIKFNCRRPMPDGQCRRNTRFKLGIPIWLLVHDRSGLLVGVIFS